MQLPCVQFTLWRLIVAVAAAAVSLAAWNRAMEAYDVHHFQRGWATRDVEGEITAVDHGLQHVAITMGTDDGLVAGEVLYIFRAGLKIRYIGKIRVISAKCESAAGQIVACARGFAIREGDCVAHFTWVEPYGGGLR